MSTRLRLGMLSASLATLAACWQLALAQESPPQPPSPSGASSELLGGADRYLTHVSTDKPIYRPGEQLYVRGVVLHHLTNSPLSESISAAVEIVGPKGDVVASGPAVAEDSVLAFAWTIPAEQAGGQYTVKLTHPWTGDAPAERKFDIRAYRAPRLRSQIKFLRDGYGPGDEVVATLEVTRAEGGIPADAKVTIVARVDGAEAFRGEAVVDATGRCTARFKLPEGIERGEGSLAMAIEDGGVVETASKTIPILMQTIDLNIYPEGGDLVAGLSNRVYFEAFTPAGKPADLAGIVLDSNGREVATFRSEHEGRGRFTFTPAAGEHYKLKINEPAGIRTTYPLPHTKSSGVLLNSLDDVSTRKARLQLVSTSDRSISVTLSKCEHVLDRKQLEVTGTPVDIELSCGEASGVLVATAWNSEGKPLAERLVFAQPQHAVQVDISADRPRYVPGGKAALSITTTDESGKPTSSIVGVTVTDDSVLEMIERREQAPRLPVMVLLEADVHDLADAHVYLDRENAQAPAAIDLLLGTQGWRRFAFVEVPRFAEKHGDRARRALAIRLPTPEVWPRGGVAFGGGNDRLWRSRALNEAVPMPAGEPQSGVQLLALAPAAKSGALDDGVILGEVVNGPAADEDVLAAAGGVPAAEIAPELQKIAQQRDAILGGFEAGESRRELMPFGDRSHLIRDDFVAVRVFAHAVRPERQSGERSDFTETLFWHAGVKTDEHGKANIEFDLNDAVTSFRVLADAFNAGGAIGSGSTTIESVEPFYIEPKLPLEVTSGDLVLAPVSFVNSTGETLEASLSVVSEFDVMENNDLESIKLPADSRVRQLLRIPVGGSHGNMPVVHVAKAKTYADTVQRNIVVKPLGFPIERGRGGIIDSGGMAEHVVDIPETLVAGSVRTKVVVYPTPLASMTEALERLIQEPCGCFEQTSSTIYPLVMAQQYFLEHQGVDPAIIERSAAILQTGYDRLIGFECKSGGYEWFGADPGHDALTAYGLMEFTDMARVRNVDPQMLTRTRKWLLDQRDGKGGFARKANTLHTWLPDPEVANTYNTWAMFEAGVGADFTAEVDWVRQAAQRTENTYVVALAANVLNAGGDDEGVARLLDKLAGQQQADGSLRGATVSVVGSSGEALQIETTALAVLAWLRDERYAPQVEKGIQFLAECCKAGRFGSTQSTVLALKAITAYDRSRAKPKAPGKLRLVVDGQPVGEPIPFTLDTQGAIELPEFAKLLSPGRHQVELHMTGGSQMPFSIAVDFFAAKPDSSEKCKLDISATLNDVKVTEGELTEVRLEVANKSDEAVPSPITIVGIPGGLEVRHDQLKELVKAGRIAAYEVLGRDVVLYWRSLAGKQRVELPISAVAAVPGTYTGPASRAYLYYTDEDKAWVDALRIEIVPRP
jgi:alpha-2-macroglobulin-like protein